MKEDLIKDSKHSAFFLSSRIFQSPKTFIEKSLLHEEKEIADVCSTQQIHLVLMEMEFLLVLELQIIYYF